MSGALMLEKHPYCGMYIDELVWLVYRTKAAKETDEDQQVCGMKHLWRTEGRRESSKGCNFRLARSTRRKGNFML